MPKLWDDTIEAHRRAVRDATLDTTATLIARHGLANISMSSIAHATGIGRATLYKYFPDVDAILLAWHERQIQQHLAALTAARDHAHAPLARLQAVLTTFAQHTRAQHDGELAALLHRGAHVQRAQQHLLTFLQELLADAAATGDVRADVPPEELARYCLHALTAAGAVSTPAATQRLVTVILAGLQPDG